MTITRLPVLDQRRAGVLLPLSALPRPLGHGGRAFVDFLAAAGFSVWQVLPLGPTGADGSPYWVSSDRAGNAALLDPQEMPPADGEGEAQFLAQSQDWLPDYALFEALTRALDGAAFWQWPPPLRDREPVALAEARGRFAEGIAQIMRQQFAFARQWDSLRDYARARGVRIFGDLPFYVAPSSVDTWTHRRLFRLQPGGAPAVAGGVPPDYFSPLGQLWGNPVYDWEAMAREDFRWWRGRVAAQLQRMDLLRLDHFRGLSAYWAVPAPAQDARGGGWNAAPGHELLARLLADFPDRPLVAEDLGDISAEVLALRDAFALPGMRVLQFAFDGDTRNPHLPFRHVPGCVVYTGTHDNDTTLGWYSSLPQEAQERVDFLLDGAAGMPRELVRAALGSVAQLAVIPLQDLLGLPGSARLNTPGTTVGNWSWRVPPDALTGELAAELARLNRAFGRA